MNNVEKKNMLWRYVIASIGYWLIFLGSPFILWIMSAASGIPPIWIGWKWTMVVYAICIGLYVIACRRFIRDYRVMDAEQMERTPRT